MEPTIAFRQDSYARKQLLSAAFEWGYENPNLDPMQKFALDPVFTRYRAKMESYLIGCLQQYRANPDKTYSQHAAHQAELDYMAELERKLRMVANPGEIRTAIIRGQELAAHVGPEPEPAPPGHWSKGILRAITNWTQKKRSQIEDSLTLQQALQSRNVNRQVILRIAEREALTSLGVQAA